MTCLPDIINSKIEQFSGAMEALAKGDGMNCIHDWDFASEKHHLYCTKCPRTLIGPDIINHMNMLESDLANTRALYAEKQAEIAALDAHVSEWQACIATRDALIKRLVEAGNCLSFEVYYTDAFGGELNTQAQIDWRKFVDEWRASKDGGAK